MANLSTSAVNGTVTIVVDSLEVDRLVAATIAVERSSSKPSRVESLPARVVHRQFIQNLLSKTVKFESESRGRGSRADVRAGDCCWRSGRDRPPFGRSIRLGVPPLLAKDWGDQQASNVATLVPSCPTAACLVPVNGYGSGQGERRVRSRRRRRKRAAKLPRPARSEEGSAAAAGRGRTLFA